MNAKSDAVSTYTQLLDAWNRRDADAFASLFTEDGSSVGFDGSQMNGRTEIAETLRQIFADHQTATYAAKILDVRRVGPAVDLLRAVAGMMPRGATELNPALNAIQSLVVVNDAGVSRIALLHNTPAAFHGRPEAVERLTAELMSVVRRGDLVGR